MRKNNKGITLIALIVTIIVLIIIAGISIASLTSDNGIIRQTNAAKVEQIEGTAREQVKLAISAMRLAIAEASSQDNSYSAKQNARLIQSKLIEVLNADKQSLTGEFYNGGIVASNGNEGILIAYTGDDYENACNQDNASIVYSIRLNKSQIELIGEKTAGSNDTIIDIREELSFDELVDNGIIHVENGVITTNYDATTGVNISDEKIYGKLVIPEGVTSIGEYAFKNCTNITSVIIPDSVENIGIQAFAGCMELESIKLSSELKQIGASAFNKCSSLKSIEIPDTVTTISGYSFRACSSLTNISLPDTITTIEEGAFQECLSIVSIEIPGSVTTWGTGVFNKCTKLETVTIKYGVTAIPGTIFLNCEKLKNVSLPNSIKSIGGSSFHGCTSLENIEIPASIETISRKSFNNCINLTNVTVLATTPPTIDNTTDGATFLNTTALTTITVPAGTLDAYKSAWTSVEDKIKEVTE